MGVSKVKLLIYLLAGFVLSAVYFLLFDMDLVSGMETNEIIKEATTYCLILAPAFAAVIWTIKAAVLPLIQDFVDGDIKTKLLIATIVIALWQLKMQQHY